MKKVKVLLSILVLSISFMGCEIQPTQPTESTAGVKKAQATVQTDLQGHTVEQNNISRRLLEDNKPGAIKHLYIISAYSGQVIIYSTVKGKVTSSGKRLTPLTVAVNSGEYNAHDGIPLDIAGRTYVTPEVIQDDGVYGSSVEYIYWWDSKDVYHQQYITGGMIVHISNQPIAAKSVTINMEETKR